MIETERLILRNYKMEDLDDYFEYVSMESVGPRVGWPAYTDAFYRELEKKLITLKKKALFVKKWKDL